MKTKTKIIIASAVLVGLGGFYIFKNLKENSKIQVLNEQDTTDTTDNNKLNMDLVLSKGSKGAEVTELQRILKKDYNAELGTSGINKDGIDGDFGTKTETALKNAKSVTQITLKQMIKT